MPRFSELSAPRQAFVRLCQSINHGHIEALQIRDGELTFAPPPRVLVDVKLDQDEAPRSELALPDFELCAELRRLMSRIDAIKEGRLARVEVRAGIPRRLVFEAQLLEGIVRWL